MSLNCSLHLLSAETSFPDSYQQSLYLVQHVKVDWNHSPSSQTARGVREQWLLKSLNVCPACSIVILTGISSVLWSWWFSAILFLPGELFQLLVRAVCSGLNLGSSAVQSLSCRFGFLCLQLFLLHHFCFLSVCLLTPQSSAAILPKYVSCLLCFHEKTGGCWPLSVQEGSMSHPESARPLLSFFFFFPFESCISSC